VALFLVSPAAAQQNITVRLVDYKSEKPIVGSHVAIEYFNGDLSKGLVSKAKVILRITGTTDANGSVTVRTPEPVPEHMRVDSLDLRNSTVDLSPADAVRSGVLVQYRDASEDQKKKMPVRRGEVVILGKPTRWWERLLQEIP
jgi:uncharacterized GH25 family protein